MSKSVMPASADATTTGAVVRRDQLRRPLNGGRIRERGAAKFQLRACLSFEFRFCEASGFWLLELQGLRLLQIRNSSGSSISSRAGIPAKQRVIVVRRPDRLGALVARHGVPQPFDRDGRGAEPIALENHLRAPFADDARVIRSIVGVPRLAASSLARATAFEDESWGN
jgi:hypothetical protein